MILRKDKSKNSTNQKKEKIITDRKKSKINKDLIIASDDKKDFDPNIDSIKIKKENSDLEKIDSENEYNNEKKHKFKRLFFGLGKEFWRISWPSNKKILNDFITAIIVIAFFVLIFSGIGFLIGTFVN